ncbi:hypothetical protein [Rhodopseudomonas palustris]|uniref:Metallo-beta-lactamase domain-containing protein n=1 Tax=Rhodopseudomonas palustris (strain BisB18) TaxID=316056 RepID=Q217T4_RHOPB
MHFSLDVLPARKGDCLMLHYGSDDDPHLILIDGGPSDVYAPQLKPRLELVRGARGIDETEPLPLDVVMVSHIDDDHIRGIIELSEEQLHQTADLKLKVKTLWHNSFDDLLGTKPGALTAGFGTASVLAGLDSPAVLQELDPEREVEQQTIELLASIPQERTLRDNADKLKWKPNDKFKGDLILAKPAAKPVALAGGLKVAVIGPMQQELQALQAAHDKWLRAQKAGKKKTPEAALAAYVDQSVPNLSSIVVLAELQNKRILLTGDARGDKIIEGMELVGLLKKGGKLHLEILKVPHHGSDNNMETGFFKRVTADHYVFSGDGEHGNPERNTLQMLLDARGTDDDYTIHLTYPIDDIDVARKADWTKEQSKEKNRHKKNPAKPVRENWSPAKHGLAAFFKAHPDFAAKVVTVEPQQPHLIDLLDPVAL